MCHHATHFNLHFTITMNNTLLIKCFWSQISWLIKIRAIFLQNINFFLLSIWKYGTKYWRILMNLKVFILICWQISFELSRCFQIITILIVTEIKFFKDFSFLIYRNCIRKKSMSWNICVIFKWIRYKMFKRCFLYFPKILFFCSLIIEKRYFRQCQTHSKICNSNKRMPLNLNFE